MPTVLFQLLEDFLSAISFVVAFVLTRNLLLATGLAIAVAIGQFVLGVMRRQRPSLMRWAALALAIGLGSLTVLTRDSRYMQLKPTIAHVAIGALMFKRGWLGAYLPPIAKQWLPATSVIRWGYAWAYLMLATGIANVAAAEWLSVPVWGAFLTAMWLAKLVFGAVQYVFMRRAVIRRMSVELPVAEA